MENMEFNFKRDEDLRVTEGTEAVLTAIPGQKGELVETDRVKNNTENVIRMRFQIAEGKHAGKRASLTMWPGEDGNTFSFRKRFQQLTGIDVANGESGSMKDLLDAAAEKSFLAVLGIDKNGYTIVTDILEQLPYVPVVVSTPIQTGNGNNSAGSYTAMGGASAEEDDDIPF